MKTRAKFAFILAAVALAAPQGTAFAKAPDAKAWSGNWQMNLAKSKFSSAQYTPKSDMRSYMVSGNHVTMHSTMVNGEGKTIKWSYSANADGKWYPVSGNPNADRIAITMAGPREAKSETRLKDKPSAHSTLSVSADGREIMVARSLVTPKGATDDHIVYDRMK